jgi:hypothetical protein
MVEEVTEMLWNIVIVLSLLDGQANVKTTIKFDDSRVFQEEAACGAGLADIDLKSYSVIEAVTGHRVPWRFEAYCEEKI